MRRNPAGVEAARELPHLPGVGHEQPEAANVRLRNRVGGWFLRPSDLRRHQSHAGLLPLSPVGFLLKKKVEICKIIPRG